MVHTQDAHDPNKRVIFFKEAKDQILFFFLQKLKFSLSLSQNNVRTEARRAERPLRSREEHSAEEADERT